MTIVGVKPLKRGTCYNVVSSPASPTFIVFSPEQFVYFMVAIVVATAGIISWVYKQTHSLDKNISLVKKDIENIQKSLDEQSPKIREMEIILVRFTERLSKRVRDIIDKEEGEGN